MRVDRVILENFGSFYGRHEFVVADRGLVLVLGENCDEPRMNSNGAAKSTLLESIDWCLFGVVPKGDHADSVVNDESDSCRVIVHLADDGASGVAAQIERARPSELLFSIGGVPQVGLDTRETQRWINAWLGVDREVFHAAVFFGQDDVRHFADSTDTQRMEILTRIIPELGEVDRMLGPAKAAKERCEAQLAAMHADVQVLDREITTLESFDFEKQIAEWEAQRNTDLKRLNDQIDALVLNSGQFADPTVTIAHLEGELRRIEGMQLVLEPSIPQELTVAQAELNTTREQYAVARANARRVEGELSKINGVQTGRCPLCGNVVSADHLGVERDRLRVQLDSHRAVESQMLQQGEAMAGKVRHLDEGWAQSIRQVRQQREQHQAQLNSVRMDLQTARGVKREIDRIGVEIGRFQALIATKKAEQNPRVSEAVKMQQRLVEVKAAWREKRTAATKLTVDRNNIDFWVGGFGPQGLKSYILDSKLQELTDAANEWVRLLTGGTFWVRFESQKQGRTTKTLKNAPTIRVFKYQPTGQIVERNFKGWSGGEKQRVSWCIDFGLSRLVARRATKSWDLLVLDEVFKYVDSAGGEAVVEMLTQLRQEKSSIFVVEHDSEFQSYFESVLVVRKERGRSQIIEGVTDGCQRQAPVQSGWDGKKIKRKRAAKRKPSDSGNTSESQAKPKRKAAVVRVPGGAGL